jgi:alpha-tubulin suppressor-like RCC1 family protein
VSGISTAVALATSATSLHACVLLQDGSVACWGDNEAGELGDGTMDARDKAELVRW